MSFKNKKKEKEKNMHYINYTSLVAYSNVSHLCKL